ncbi:hypothetical protein B0T24DRAFT_526190 [Lasiosphaeria ovina]|uniref:DUF1857-domain-containing protein n=1 Tax=Lasiosphaeria ovina TaxID=92902 RepID=A0AAE0NAG2_9PEZI|nr:hypothetical protein B0T24DRAFT_526190 [Lasiosphaeria ovina]
MVVINLGYTSPINRPGQSPVLTQAQVYARLELKVRQATSFVPLIAQCTVISEETNTDTGGSRVVTREVQFRAGAGPRADGGPVREVCMHFAPARIDFCQDNGTTIGNYVTLGPGGEPHGLFLTFVFMWRYPAVAAGSEQALKLEAVHKDTAKSSVEATIEGTRQLVAQGEIA